MSTKLLDSYIRAQGEHFFSLDDIPIIRRDMSVHDALVFTAQEGAQGAFLRVAPTTYKLLTLDRIARFQKSHSVTGAAIPQSIFRLADELNLPELPRVTLHLPLKKMRPQFRGEKLDRVALVMLGGVSIGMLSEAETWNHAFRQPATIYRCNKNPEHMYAPPAPDDCFYCPGKVVKD